MYNMKSTWIALLLLFSQTIFAQSDHMKDEMHEGRKEKIESLKRAYISDKL